MAEPLTQRIPPEEIKYTAVLARVKKLEDTVGEVQHLLVAASQKINALENVRVESILNSKEAEKVKQALQGDLRTAFDRIKALENAVNSEKNRGGRGPDAVTEQIFEFLKTTGLKFNPIMVAQNLGIENHTAGNKLQTLFKSGRIKWHKDTGRQGYFWYEPPADAEESENEVRDDF